MADMETRRLDFLDGLRGWGAIVVLLFHIIDRFLADAYPWLRPTWTNFLLDGPFAVLVFFVVSGFALSYTNLDHSRRNLEIAVTARYFRLALPILITTFICYLMMKAGLIINIYVSLKHDVSSDWLGTFYNFDESIYTFLKFSFYNAFFDYRSETSYNSSLWTIPIEFVGSLFIYGYLALLRNKRQISGLIVVIVFAALFKISPYMACFFGGYILAEVYSRFTISKEWKLTVELLSWLTVYGIVHIITFSRPQDNQSLGALAIILVGAATFSSSMRFLLSNTISKFLGRISFPLYLIHIVVICSWTSWLFDLLPTLGFSGIQAVWINIFSSVALSIVAAWLLSPTERLSVVLSKRIATCLLAPVSFHRPSWKKAAISRKSS